MSTDSAMQITQTSQMILASSFSAKCSTKGEVWRFLTTDAKVYLPSYATVTIWHMKDLASSQKKPIYCDDVKVIYIPQYEQLSMDKIIDFGLSKQEVVNCLPIIREIRKMPRQYVSNVIFTLTGSIFQKWVDHRILERNQNLTISKDLNIKLDPKIAKAYLASTAVSQQRGTGSLLMKVGSKRRRSKQEIEDQKMQALLKKEAIEDKLKSFEKLQRELQATQQQVLENQDAKEIVQNMLDQGFVQINPDGVMVPGQQFDQQSNK